MACSTFNLNYSSLPPTQNVLAGMQWIKTPCLTSIDSSDSPLEFRIDKTNSFIDLSQLYLQINLKITDKEGKDVGDSKVFSTVNNFGYSMFSSVEVYIQDQKVSMDETLYPWMMYVKVLTGCTKQEMDYFLNSAMWKKDAAALFDKLIVSGALKNDGFVNRAEKVMGSKNVKLLVKVCSDFTLDRLIPDQTEIFLRFKRSDPSLCLLAKDGEYKIKLSSAELLVPKVTLTQDGLKSAHSMLNSAGLNYMSTRTSVRTKVISKNDQNCDWVPFFGNLPKRIFIFQLSQKAFNGDIAKNIFNFENFNLKQIQVYRNDESLPLASSLPVDWSFPNLLYMHTLMAIGDPAKVNFSSFEFTNGYGLMCFDLTDDMSASSGVYRTHTHSGTLRLSLDYAKPLPDPIVLFCMGEFDSVLHIDNHRNTSWKT